MYRFLLKPRWIAFHLLVAGLVVVMVLLGLWQLRRLDERRDRNDEVRARQSAPPVAVQELGLTPDDDLDAAGELQWQPVTATGRYDVGAQVLVRNRSLNGAPGEHVVTPLVLADGTAVLVNRGWVPLPPAPDQPPLAPDPPSVEVTVEGRVRATQRRGSFGPRDPATGVLSEVNRIDIERLARQVPYPLLPVSIELTAQNPAPEGDLPAPLPAPELSDGPHLAYAGQWFLFSIVAVIGWVMIVRISGRKARQQAARDDANRAAVAAAREAPPLRSVRTLDPE